MVEDPVPIGVRRDVGAFVRIHPEVVDLGQAQWSKRLGPNRHCARHALLGEHHLEVVVAHRHQVAFVAEIEELLTRIFRGLAGQVRQQVVAVEMHFESRVADLHALHELLFHVGNARGREECGHEIQVRHNAVVNRAGFDVARPFHHRGHPVGAFPVGVLLAAEGGHAGIRPGVHVRTVVGGVHDERVVRDAQIVQRLENRADVLVVVNHRVVILALEPTGLPDALWLHMGPEVHVSEVHPNEGGSAGQVLPSDEVRGAGGHVIVDGFHPLLGQRAGVLAHLLADFAEARIHRRVVGR